MEGEYDGENEYATRTEVAAHSISDTKMALILAAGVDIRPRAIFLSAVAIPVDSLPSGRCSESTRLSTEALFERLCDPSTTNLYESILIARASPATCKACWRERSRIVRGIRNGLGNSSKHGGEIAMAESMAEHIRKVQNRPSISTASRNTGMHLRGDSHYRIRTKCNVSETARSSAAYQCLGREPPRYAFAYQLAHQFHPPRQGRAHENCGLTYQSPLPATFRLLFSASRKRSRRTIE